MMIVRLKDKIRLDTIPNVFIASKKPRFYGFCVLQGLKTLEGNVWVVTLLSTSKQELKELLSEIGENETMCQIITFNQFGERIFTIESTTNNNYS